MYRRRIIRIVALVLSLALMASLLVCFASAENIESWVIVEWQGSNDGSTWSGSNQLSLTNNTQYALAYDYVRISKIRVLNTTNNPSDIFISFKISGYYPVSNDNYSCSVTNGTVNNWTNSSNNSGYFRTRSAGLTEITGVNEYSVLASSVYFIGQYNIPEANDTAFTLTPSSYPTFRSYAYSSNQNHICYLYVSDVNIVFVGDQNNIYQVTADVQALLATFDLTKEMLEDIWQYLANSTYVYYRYAGWNNPPTSSTTTNPYAAMVSAFSTLTRQFTQLCTPHWNFYDSSNTLQTSNWFDAILQNQNQLVNETRKQSELMAKMADAQDILEDAYDSPNMPGFLGLFANFLGLGNLGSFTSNSPNIFYFTSWFSQNNHDLINGSGTRNDSDIVDFYSQNIQDIFGGD